MFIKSLKGNRYWRTIFLVGLLTLIFGIIFSMNVSIESDNISMLQGMIVGLGASFTLIGIIKLIQNKMSPIEKLKANEIEAKDERNIEILRISLSISSTIATVLFAVLGFVFVALNYIVPAFIAVGAMYIQVLSYFIAYNYYNKKM